MSPGLIVSPGTYCLLGHIVHRGIVSPGHIVSGHSVSGHSVSGACRLGAYCLSTHILLFEVVFILAIQEPLLDLKVICYQMSIAKLEDDLWIIYQIGKTSDYLPALQA